MSDSSKTPKLPKPPRAWMTLLMGGILLISGMVMGAGGSIVYLKNSLDEPVRSPKRFNKILRENIAEDLKLDAEQSEKVSAILEGHQKRMQAIRTEVHDEVEASFEAFESEVETILTPEQAKLWEKRVRKYRERGSHDHRGSDDSNKDGKHDGQRDGDRDGDRPPPPPEGHREGDRPPPPPPDSQ